VEGVTVLGLHMLETGLEALTDIVNTGKPLRFLGAKACEPEDRRSVWAIHLQIQSFHHVFKIPERTLHSQMVTPAIPTHSCKICNQMTNCTLLAICKSLFPLPTNIDQ
jgi:hypothetical protein